MKRHVAVMVCVLGLLGAGCAGSLEDPSRFEQGVQTAQGEPDAGAPTGGDDQSEDDGADADDGAEEAPTGDGDGDGDPAPVACDFEGLMVLKCGNAGCHADFQSAGSLDLISDDLGGRLSGLEGQCTGDFPMVAPGNAEGSLLYLKLTDTPPCGSKMPLGGSFTADEMACVANWINGL